MLLLSFPIRGGKNYALDLEWELVAMAFELLTTMQR
jgi:hypothetical protein